LPAAAADAAQAVRVIDIDEFDAARNRPVPLRLYLPAEAGAAAPLPLVVFSHGIGGSRLGYSYLGRHWAARGHASLHVQHVGSDRNLWRGNPLALLGRLQDAAQEAEAVARVADLRFGLDRVLAGAHGEWLDARHIVAAGHSYGANTTLLAAGARVPRAGAMVDLRDERVRAAIVISAPPFYGETALADILASVTVPSLHVTATEDVIRIPGYYSGPEDRVAVFEAAGGTPKVLAVFEGGSHSMFTDRAGTGGALLNPRVKAATQALTAAFLDQVLRGRDDALRDWPERFGPLVARFERRPA
jgi:dienelactone hydrolase